MKKPLLLSLALAVGIVSCDEERETKVDFLTVEVGELSSHSSDFWLFATNEKGEILDVAQYRSGVTFSLSTSQKYARIDLTFLEVFEVNGNRKLNVSTHKNFPTGETTKVGAHSDVETTPSPSAGIVHITVENYSEVLNPAHNLRFSQHPFGSVPMLISSTGSSYKVAMQLGKSPTNMMVFGLKNKVPGYKILTNLKSSDEVVVDFQSFQPYENLIEIKGINGFTYVQGIVNNDLSAWQEILLTDSFLNPDAIYLATIPGFSKYTMRVYSYADGRDYYRVGPPITSFFFPEYSTTITDNSFENFNTEIDIDYDYKTVNWQGTSGTTNITWGVTADNKTSLGIDLNIPGQITNLYPELRTKEFVNLPATFFRSNGSFTYDDLFNWAYKGQRKSEYEQYTLPAK